MKNNNDDLKPLTQEEFEIIAEDHMTYSIQDLLEAARLGYVPRSETIQIPDVKDWPQWATGISARFLATKPKYYSGVGFCYDRSTAFSGKYDGDGSDQWSEIQFIPRPDVPIPKWTPSIGDPVFFRHPLDEYTIHVGIYQGKDEREYPIIHNLNNLPLFVNDGEIKPFRTEHIGKRWKEIPSV